MSAFFATRRRPLNTEVSPAVAVNSTDPSNIIGVYQQDAFSGGSGRGLVAAVRHNGGETWAATFPPFSICAGGDTTNGGDFQRSREPKVTFAPNGDAYFTSRSANQAGTRETAVLVTKSTDGGDHWSQPITLVRNFTDLIAAVVAWLLRGVRPARVTLVLLGVALVGVLLVVTKGHLTGLFAGGTGFGDLMMFLGGVSWVIYTLGAADFPSWSPLRYTALTCMLSLPAILGVTAIATGMGYVSTPSAGDIESVGWQLAYMILVASVLGVLSWNAGNKLIGVANGMLFINFVPVTVFAIRIAQGHHFQPIEFVGAALVIGALIANNAIGKRVPVPAQQRATKAARYAPALHPRDVKPQGCG